MSVNNLPKKEINMSTHPLFAYNEEMFGGTETMARGFHTKILPAMKNIQNYKCVILPGYLPDARIWGTDGEKTILWLHNNIIQFGSNSMITRLLENKLIKESIAYIVAVSEYQRHVIAKEINFPLEKIVVIPNAIEPPSPMPNKFNNIDKVKLIHASSMDRGLALLMDAVPLITEDFELNVFNNFYPDVPNSLNIDGVNDPRVNFWGKTPRKMVYKFMSEAHIHAYPSTYPETSCLTQMEALSAGCYPVHTDLGALPETSLGHGLMIPFENLSPAMYAVKLSQAIRSIKENGHDYTQQVKDMHDNFTWDKAKQNWLAFDAIL